MPYEKIGKETRCIADEIPFEIPDSWEWVTLRHIAITELGKTLDKAKNQGTLLPYLCSINVYWTGIDLSKVKQAKFENDELERFLLQKGDLLVCEGGDIGRCAIWDSDQTMYYQNALHRIRFFANLNSLYFRFLLECYKGIGIIDQYSKGMTIKHLVQSSLNSIMIPLPPLAEQKRIVAKIKELLPHLEDYDRAETQVSKLNTEFPELLKKSILQWAIQGKLVPQDPADEPASVLLERIRAEKAKLVKAGKIKKDKNESVIFRRDNSHYEKLNGVERCIDDEIPFEIPDSWEWVCLEQICIYIQRGKSPKYSLIKKYPVIAQKCNQWTGFSIEKAQFIAPETISSYSEERFMQDRDLLWNSTGLGTLGRMAIYRTELNPYGIAVADSHVTVIRPCSLVLSEFLFYYFANPTVQTVIEEQSDGSTKQKELSRNTVRAYWVPLPPLAEQKRIVAEIEMLFSLQRTMRHS